MTDPNALKEPNPHIDPPHPDRQAYAKAWQEVKAS